MSISFIASLALVGEALGQSLIIAPSGTSYRVSGEFQGEPMEPWESVIVVKDSVVDGKAMILVTRRTNRGGGATFESTASIDPATGNVVAVSGWNRGRVVSEYRFRMSNGRITGTDQEDGATAVHVDAELIVSAIPDFALGHVLASRTLADGDSTTVAVFTQSGSSIRRYPFVARVRSATFAGARAPAPEPVWIVEGGSGYAARITIAKSDRRVLEILLPQGTVGSQTETYVGGATP